MSESIPPSPEPTLPASVLERRIGKPAAEWELADLVGVVRDSGIRIVSLMHVGGDGQLKTLDFVPADVTHLEGILRGGERADGSNLFPGLKLSSGKSDIVLRPRFSRAFLDPFSNLPTLAVLCDHLDRDGELLPESPGTIVRRAWERLRRERGVELQALGEVEYFLGRRSSTADIYGQEERGYHAVSPFVFGQGLRRRALTILAEIGIPVKYGHSEVGFIKAGEQRTEVWEQHEIELGLAPLPAAADAVVLTQWVLMNLAHRSEFRLSFEPIIRVGHAGSGLHFHFSPVMDGEHRGGREEGGDLHRPAKWVISGLVSLGGALMAFGNRTEGSFIRLGQKGEAPHSVSWGEFDRKALVRLPVVARAEDGSSLCPSTIEFRLADGTAHAHHLLAGVAQGTVWAAGRDDLEEILDRSTAARARAQPDAATPVPRTHSAVIEALSRQRGVFEAGGVFPTALIDRELAPRS